MFCAWALAIVATEFHDLAILTDWTLLSAKSFTGRSSPLLSAFSTTTSFSAKEEFFVVFVSELVEVCSDRSCCIDARLVWFGCMRQTEWLSAEILARPERLHRILGPCRRRNWCRYQFRCELHIGVRFVMKFPTGLRR